MKSTIFFASTIITLLVLAPSCVSKKNHHVERAYQGAADYGRASQRDSLRTIALADQRHLVATTYTEAVTIIPSGVFTYHPDSGYSGGATVVEVQREGVRSERRSSRDSTLHDRQQSVTTMDSLVIQQRNELKKGDTWYSPWWWVLATLVSVIFVLLTFRWFHR